MNNKFKKACRIAGLGSILAFAACASGPSETPYPSFIQSNTLPETFIAGLPGVSAIVLAGNPDTRRASIHMSLPPGWSFSTGAEPGKSVEMYILAGDVHIGEFTLSPGSYAYLPSGTTGLQMSTDEGASLLYFLDREIRSSVIRTPMLLSRDILTWQPVSDDPNDIGVSFKELRFDPGSGARTSLLRIESGATRPWVKSSVSEEGFLLEGSYQHSECVEGEELTDIYTPGGFYNRPAGAINGSPLSGGVGTAVWLVRTRSFVETVVVEACVTAEPQ
jgi:hypothetical protein